MGGKYFLQQLPVNSWVCNVMFHCSSQIIFESLCGSRAWFYITGFHLWFQFQEILILGVRGVLLLERGCPAVVSDGRAVICPWM